jgi:hypothetical protein
VSTYVATAHKLFMGGLDVSCFSDTFNLDLSADPVECTTFCSAGSREYKQGLKTWASSADGYVDFAAAADTASPLVPGEVIVPANQGSQFNATWASVGTEGTWCYLSDGVLGTLTPIGGAVGEMAVYHAELMPADRTVGHRMVHGILEANRTVSSSSNTTGAATLGAISATQTMYASLHVFQLTGTSPTLDVIVQSDTVGFGSPTDQITFTQATTRSGQYGSKAGAVTDTFWRVKWTLGGSGGPTATFAVSLGII